MKTHHIWKKCHIGILCIVCAFFIEVKSASSAEHTEHSLKRAVEGNFLMGVALNTRQVNGRDQQATRLIKQHFNSIVAENCMKSSAIHPEKKPIQFCRCR